MPLGLVEFMTEIKGYDRLNVAKCNLGKVNLEAMLVSSFPNYTRGGRCL